MIFYRPHSLPEARLRYFFDEQNLDNLKLILQVVKFINEYHEINPVVFSITPGKVAPTVGLPENGITKSIGRATSSDVGPICRRLVLRLETAPDQALSLSQLIKGLTCPNLDVDQSPVSVSFYKEEDDALKNWNVFRR
jgi:hypothetical protein